MSFLRYPEDQLVVSDQEPFSDVLDLLGFLCSRDYLGDLIVKKHKLTRQQSKSRTTLIIPYIKIASDYIRQSLEGPKNISFLPAYYAILNLMKVYILLSPKYDDLKHNRWHGATYKIHSKDSKSILYEKITIKNSGTIPLFYESITGQKIPRGDNHILIGEILPYVTGIEHEYNLATGNKSQICELRLDFFDRGGNRPRIKIKNWDDSVPKRKLKILKEFKAHPSEKNIFLGKIINNEQNNIEEFRDHLRSFLIYNIHHQATYTPICAKNIMMPQELPIVLLFFYMSNIVRYKPDYLTKIMDTKYWPLLSLARKHSFYKFINLFWAFMHQSNYFIKSDTF